LAKKYKKKGVLFVLKSMTGFGRGDYDSEAYKIHIEIKSINNRYYDIACHMPRTLNVFEEDIRKCVSGFIARGKVDVFITFSETSGGLKKIKVDKNLVISYHKALNEISDILRLPRPDAVHQISNYPDVLTVEEDSLHQEAFKEPFLCALQEAVDHLFKMRTVEGQHIYEDLKTRLQDLTELVDSIEEYAPMIVEEYRQRLRQFLLAELSNVDETRVIQEAALFADKVNFTEEIVRLRSHFKQFSQSLEEKSAVGRKLDFIVQEMNRETNTIAAKANSAKIASLVVELKSGIEKIREQIQNIE
jgi:uncharacterized protein (TIGR00255 family)